MELRPKKIFHRSVGRCLPSVVISDMCLSIFRSLSDSRYVIWMKKYLFVVGRESPIASSSTSSVDLRVYLKSPDARPADIMFQLKYWYALSIITRRFVTLHNCESLRTDRSEFQFLGYYRRDIPTSDLRLPLTCFPKFPAIFSRTPLPPGLPVMIPLVLLYFPSVGSFISSLCLSAGSVAEERYGRVLDIESAMKNVATLYDDLYWSQRSTWVSPTVINSIRMLLEEVFQPLIAYVADG